VSLAAILHGIVALLAVSMGMGLHVPEPVISISLLPALSSGAPAAREGRTAQGMPAAARSSSIPASPRQAAAQKPLQTAPQAEGLQVRAQAAAPVPQGSKKAVAPAVAAAPPQIGPRQAAPSDQDVLANAHAAGEAGQSREHDEPARDEPAPGSGGRGGSGSAVSGAPGSGGDRFSAGTVGASFGDADGPRFVQRVMPRYPELARRRGREGLVLLRLVIGPGGELRDVQVVEGGGHGFDEAALAAVRASLYAPAMRGGRGVECAALLPIRFALKGS
jgi:protein TonB